MPDRYVVIENTPGYLPEDDDPATFDTLEDAVIYAAERAAELVDHYGECDGTPHISTSPDGTCHAISDTSNPHSLGRVIEVMPTED